MKSDEKEQNLATAGTPAEQDEDVLAPGALIAEKYRILSLLGKGGMGAVYKAQHQLMNTIVAIKLLHKHLVHSKESLMRFRQEAEAAHKLESHNIIKVYDFGITPDGQAYQVMEYLDGQSLADIIKENGALPPDRAAHIFIQAAGALQHAHENGIIHRDLKPSNIMILKTQSEPDLVKIVDFGIAKVLPGDGQNASKLTQTGELFGSPLYMSPEQCMGGHLDGRSDVYSMGCLIYEALTGKPPLAGNNVYETIYKQINTLPESLSQARPDLPDASQLEAIVLKCMAKEPSQRYDSMEALKSELELLRNGSEQSISVRITRSINLLNIRISPLKKKWPIKLIAALFGLLLICLAVFGWMGYSTFSASAAPHFQENPWQRYSVPHLERPDSYDDTAMTKKLMADKALKDREIPDDEKAQALQDVTAFFARYGDFDEAVRYGDQLMPVLGSLKFESLRDKAIFFKELADSCYASGRYQEAGKLYDETADILSNYHDRIREQGYFDVYKNRADCEYLNNKPQQALSIYQTISGHFRGAILEEGLASRETYALFYCKRGDLQRHAGQLKEALESYEQALKCWEKVEGNHDKEIGLVNYYLALTYLKAGAIPKAEKHCRLAVDLLASSLGKNNRQYAGVLQSYSEILGRMGNWLGSLSEAWEAKSVWQRSAQAHSEE